MAKKWLIIAHMKPMLLVFAVSAGCSAAAASGEPAAARIEAAAKAPPGTPQTPCAGFTAYQGATWGPDADGATVWYNSINFRLVARYMDKDRNFDAICYDLTPAGVDPGTGPSFSQGAYPWTYVAIAMRVSNVAVNFVSTDGWSWRRYGP